LLKKQFSSRLVKTSRCTAREIKRNEAYFTEAAMTKDERNKADGYFLTAC
jgi:hypothetical protein